ncbi:MAG: hypothetical protein ABSE73_19465 [Planctomycetota bacterium]
MNKPTLYADTNIPSYLHYRGSDPKALEKQASTRQWWKEERPFFEVFASRVVEKELADGVFAGKDEALAEVRRLTYLVRTSAVRQTAERLLDAHVVPETVQDDAVHLAFAIVHGVDYLLSWNRAHLVNPDTQAKLAWFWATWGMRPPLVVSPDTIPKVALGENIRRRD